MFTNISNKIAFKNTRNMYYIMMNWKIFFFLKLKSSMYSFLFSRHSFQPEQQLIGKKKLNSTCIVTTNIIWNHCGVSYIMYFLLQSFRYFIAGLNENKMYLIVLGLSFNPAEQAIFDWRSAPHQGGIGEFIARTRLWAISKTPRLHVTIMLYKQICSSMLICWLLKLTINSLQN